VITLVLTGFPIALILAWAFRLHLAGVENTPALIAPGETRPRRTRRNMAILAPVGVALSVGAGVVPAAARLCRTSGKSIAVLLFENFSADPENACFADGIQDDILTKIGDLKVISRCSCCPRAWMLLTGQ
jgi:hypothetical protein